MNLNMGLKKAAAIRLYLKLKKNYGKFLWFIFFLGIALLQMPGQ